MAIHVLNNKFYKVNISVLIVADVPFRIYFSDDEVNNLKKVLKTKEGKKMPKIALRKIVKHMINRYIEEHSD